MKIIEDLLRLCFSCSCCFDSANDGDVDSRVNTRISTVPRAPSVFYSITSPGRVEDADDGKSLPIRSDSSVSFQSRKSVLEDEKGQELSLLNKSLIQQEATQPTHLSRSISAGILELINQINTATKLHSQRHRKEESSSQVSYRLLPPPLDQRTADKKISHSVSLPIFIRL